MSKHAVVWLAAGALGLAPLTGCETIQENPRTAGAVIGGVAGAGAGALIGGEDNRVIGALIGGALGAGGGYLIGSAVDKNEDDRDEAAAAAQKAQTNPATAEQARTATTADLNGDGFVTTDEVIAMERAGLTDEVMIQRLEASGQVFDLTPEQRQYLLNQGVSQRVVDTMPTINQAAKDRVLGAETQPAPQTPPAPPPEPVGRQPAL